MLKTDAQPGDYVEIIFMKRDYRGILLESSRLDRGIVLLKLDSGYNIGFNKKDILEIKVLKKIEEKKDRVEIKKTYDKPNIAMIITGGTIASKYDIKTGGVAPLTSTEDLFRFYPELFEKVNVLKVEVPFMKSSEDMDFKDWQKLAKTAEKLLNDSNIKGIIITHGTDTLHYTSAALSFFLKDLNKPVVLTYSQKSIDRASSDANLNLQCSALVAISDIAEVMLVGHATINDDYCYALRGCNVLKLNTSRRDAFRPINDLPIAKITNNTIEILKEHNIRSKGKVKTDTKFEEKVALIKIFPGMNSNILDFYFKNKYKGIVLELSGLGHTSAKWIKKIKELSKKGIIFCGTSQCINGRVDGLVYSTGRKLIEAGVIYLEEMLSTTALVKLGWILGHKEWSSNREKIKEMMLKNFCDEIGKRILQESFLY